MFKKFIYIFLFVGSFLHSEVMTTDKDQYTTNENIVVTLEDLRGQDNDWIVIYPKGTANDNFAEIIQWQYTGGEVNEVVTFNKISRKGTYEIKVFYGGDLNTVVSKEIIVGDNAPAQETTLITEKDQYTTEEDIIVTLKGLRGENNDWIVIYPKGTANDDYGKIIQWQYTGGEVNEEVTFNKISRNGIYDIRVFYGGDLNTIVSKEIVIGEANVDEINIESQKDTYSPYELIHINFVNMSGAETDSIGIFAMNAQEAKENAIELRSTKGVIDGEISFNGLVAGTYQARAYFNNELQKTINFTIADEEAQRILYDDFEDGIDPRWLRLNGKAMLLLNYGVIDGVTAHTERQTYINGQHSLRTYNSDTLPAGQSSAYYFPFNNPNPKFKFLDIDMKIGVSSHRFSFGVKVRTKNGNKQIEFHSWQNHTLPNGQQIIRGPYKNVLEGHVQAYTNDNYILAYPGPSDYYVATSGVGKGTNMFVHYKINIEETLRVLEPDNELLEIVAFISSGGDYDNLALTTQ